MLHWPYVYTEKEWWCRVCGGIVGHEYDKHGNFYFPMSRYWNVERSEVYCGAEHSLKRHEDLQHNAGYPPNV